MISNKLKIGPITLLFIFVVILIIVCVSKLREMYYGKDKNLWMPIKPEISIPCKTDNDCYNKINELNISCKTGYELHCNKNLCECLPLQSLKK